MTIDRSTLRILIYLVILSLFIRGVQAENTDFLLERKLNPLCYISVPFQNNFDIDVPPNNGFRWTMNLMPIFPFSIGKKAEIINRVVLPVVSQSGIYGTTNQTGIGDLLINTFIAPKTGRIVWGIGPSFYFPIGYPQELSAKKWAVGPGVIAAIQSRKIMAGIILFHIWSVAGSSQRPDFSYSYLQPIAVINFRHGWGLGITSEIGLEWKTRITNGSLIITGQKLVKIGKQLINFVLGPKVFFGNFNAPAFGFRFSVNLLYPK
jgi:hypothetical protein